MYSLYLWWHRGCSIMNENCACSLKDWIHYTQINELIMDLFFKVWKHMDSLYYFGISWVRIQKNYTFINIL